MKTLLTAFGFWCLSLAAATGAEQAPRSPASKPAPNILFCIADDASAHFGAYGCTWAKTPNIDRLAQRGLTFDNVYTPTAKCSPSRAAILTGRNPWQLEAAANHQSFFPPNYPAFTEVFAEAGFGVGAQGKFWGPGIAQTAAGAERTWGLAGAASTKTGADPGIGFRKFLAARPEGKPFFYWFGSSNPHRSYLRDSGLAAGKKPTDIEQVPGFWPDNETVRRDMLDYAVEIEAYDAEVGALLKVLEESGEAENTLVVVTSDHGMPFPRVKGHNYDLSNRVPLIACWPRGIAQPGRRTTEFISLIDLAPTFLELLPIEAKTTQMAKITGASFTDLLAGEAKRERSFVVLGRERNDVLARLGTEHGLGYPVRGIREGRQLYLHNFAPERWPCGDPALGLIDTDASPTKKWIVDQGVQDPHWQLCFGLRPAEELFDLTSDPDCLKNLVGEPKHREQATALRDKLFAELRAQGDPRMLGEGDRFDRYPSIKPLPAPVKKP
ncbi:MAG: sulfatase [Planctomycetia bacterium]|nr:sulfatase [Planctomycetia bacterium]